MKKLASITSLLGLTIVSSHAAQTKCDITHWVFRDTKGNEAVVQQAFDCFEYIDRDNENPAKSSKKGVCLTWEQAAKAAKQLGAKSDDRILPVGSRIYLVLYKGAVHSIAENIVIGAPDYVLGVDQREYTLNGFRAIGPNTVFEIIGDDRKFDFSDENLGRGMSKQMYGALYGQTLVFKRCR